MLLQVFFTIFYNANYSFISIETDSYYEIINFKNIRDFTFIKDRSDLCLLLNGEDN